MTQVTRTKDQIDVITIFSQGKARPHSFKWQGKHFVVEKVNLAYSRTQGNGRVFYFSVTSEDNFFKLVFETNELKWYVEEVYSSC